jgi:anti-sigma B factor antagonist
MFMKITTRTVEGVAVVELSGRFDAHEVPEVRKQMERASRTGGGRLVINLADVNFIDSSGLASLVQAMKHCREGGGDLHLCELRQPVRIIFELTRLDRAFEIFDTADQAVTAFAS